ncbi:uncharacterized protein EI90DRAFT_3128325 [Cantharellus anzutake]|uniref:uncharacterized protein n=1 Tax=Cantharellus anzutake TaxID=1750568 RepID=UPI0019060281|nr:uncharacterized protein EI90DRAFT_3128325 [Cantharellus anzutake]KAF8325788.1 hypothetical protein EI90DRAFT_3128325 [Cantharellus anzutake]
MKDEYVRKINEQWRFDDDVVVMEEEQWVLIDDFDAQYIPSRLSLFGESELIGLLVDKGHICNAELYANAKQESGQRALMAAWHQTTSASSQPQTSAGPAPPQPTPSYNPSPHLSPTSMRPPTPSVSPIDLNSGLTQTLLHVHLLRSCSSPPWSCLKSLACHSTAHYRSTIRRAPKISVAQQYYRSTKFYGVPCNSMMMMPPPQAYHGLHMANNAANGAPPVMNMSTMGMPLELPPVRQWPRHSGGQADINGNTPNGNPAGSPVMQHHINLPNLGSPIHMNGEYEPSSIPATVAITSTLAADGRTPWDASNSLSRHRSSSFCPVSSLSKPSRKLDTSASALSHSNSLAPPSTPSTPTCSSPQSPSSQQAASKPFKSVTGMSPGMPSNTVSSATMMTTLANTLKNTHIKSGNTMPVTSRAATPLGSATSSPRSRSHHGHPLPSTSISSSSRSPVSPQLAMNTSFSSPTSSTSSTPNSTLLSKSPTPISTHTHPTTNSTSMTASSPSSLTMMLPCPAPVMGSVPPAKMGQSPQTKHYLPKQQTPPQLVECKLCVNVWTEDRWTCDDDDIKLSSS